MLRLPAGWTELLVGVWLSGFAGVLLWQLVSHLRFRRRLLAGAEPVTEYARGDDSSARGAPGLECLLKTGDGFRRLTLSEGSLALDFLDEKGRGTARLYLVDAPVDWDELFACLAEQTA